MFGRPGVYRLDGSPHGVRSPDEIVDGAGRPHLVPRTGLFDTSWGNGQFGGMSSWAKVGAGEVRAVNLNPDATIDE
jgi:hypothetical protein